MTDTAVQPLAAPPTGPLAWGQGGAYNAVDDRMVIQALTRGVTGVAIAPTLTPVASSLDITVGPWAAILAVNDGTVAVAGNRTNSTVTETAGPGSGTRTDYLWADFDATAGTWTLNIIPQASASGRTGIRLAVITVPTAANTSGAMTLTPDPVTYGLKASSYHADGTSSINPGATMADVPGASVTFTLAVPSNVFIAGQFDMANSQTGSTIAVVGQVVFDGVANTNAQVIAQANGTTSQRGTVAGEWHYPNVAAGTHTAKLQANFNGTAGNGTIRASQTGLTVIAIPL